MAQKKLLRFAQIKTFHNVFEYPTDMKGKWKSTFGNENPIYLELACGRGEYTVGLAKLHHDKNFIGIDIKGNRMYIGAKNALEQNLTNALFLRTQIEKIEDYFAKGEIAGIWITFPDPQLRASKAKKRLTHPRFLRLYNKLLMPGGNIHLKTDSPDLYEFTKMVIDMYGLNIEEQNDDVYGSECKPELSIITHYESMDIAGSNKIHYLRFTLPEVLPFLDEELKNKLHERTG